MTDDRPAAAPGDDPAGTPPGAGAPAGTPGGADDPADAARRSRRSFLGGAGLAAAGLVAGGAIGYGARVLTEPSEPTAPTVEQQDAAVVPFYGIRQAGITTAQQNRLMFASLDITSTDVAEVQRMLGRWAAMAARFTVGLPVSDAPTDPADPPLDTGEAQDLGPASLTITVGFGPGMFDDRFGLATKRPAALVDLDSIPGGGVMKPELTGGDLCIQACADDPQVVFHAVRNLVRAARGTAVLRWSQLGFGRASATGAGQTTPRNLMGFKDGTNNIHADETTDIESQVWVDSTSDQPWMVNGSYLVARKIRMEIETWDADFLGDQERVFGRSKDSGAPLSGGSEFTPLNFSATNADGAVLIDVSAHTRLASPEQNGGVRILRRGYNYTDGQDPVTGKLAAGLFFIAFQRDPVKQFGVLQTRLGQHDLLNEYIAHIGGGLWACPPGVGAAGDWFGKALFS